MVAVVLRPLSGRKNFHPNKKRESMSQLSPHAKPFTPRSASPAATVGAGAKAAPQTPPRATTVQKQPDQGTPMTNAARAALRNATNTAAEPSTWTHRGQQGQKHQQWDATTITDKRMDVAAQRGKQPAPLTALSQLRGGAASLRIRAPHAAVTQQQQQQYGTPHSRQYGTPRQQQDV